MKKILIAISVILLSLASNAQSRNCPTTANMSLMQTQDQARYQRFSDLETFTANFVTSQSNNAGRLINNNGIITIPVVFHILHRGETEGSGRNISTSQIQSQIDVLNEDFRRLNANSSNTPTAFVPIASDYGFEFRLACQDPNGNLTNGIIRRNTNRNNFQYIQVSNTNTAPNENAIGIKMSNIAGSDPWPTDRYLNIWVADFSDGTLGYATFPADYATNPNVDGIVLNTTATGRTGNVTAPFNGGRTATHEIGHWLNLRHIWGDAVCGNDFVGDTPPQAGATPNNNCPTFPRRTATCNNTTNGEMFMNYMDYTDDGCMNLFTSGQRLRGRAVFAPSGPRASFIDNYFRINTTTVNCQGDIKITNPMCAPVTYTIVSGPATIIAGQGTNNLTLRATANGTAVLRATSGNYEDEKTITMSTTPPSISYTQKQIACVNTRHYFYGAVKEIPGTGNNYDWYSKDMSNANNPFVLKQSGLGNTADFPLSNNGKVAKYYTIRVIANTVCGPLQSIDAEGYLFAPACNNNARIAITPNPTQNNMTLTLLNNEGSIETDKNKNIKEVRITDKLGNELIIKKVTNGQKTLTININLLKTDIYFVKVWDGEIWITSTLSKQ